MKGSDLVKLGEQYPDFDFDTNAKVVALTSNVVQTRY